MTIVPEAYRSFKRTHGAEAARAALLQTLAECRSVRQTARRWHCSRNTVMLARQKKKANDLTDGDRTPKHQPRMTDQAIVKLIAAIRQNKGFGKRRIKRALLIDYGLSLPLSTIGKVIVREQLPGKIYHSAWRRKTRRKYDRSSVVPFARNEVDTKDILDKKGIPKELYERIEQGVMPRWQWTWIESTSRLRFVAYSYELTWTNGQHFWKMVRGWLDTFGVTETVGCSIDGGLEWHATYERSFTESVKKFYTPLRFQMSLIRKGHPEDNPFVERSHRTDDEECYAPFTEWFVDEDSFRKITTWWHLFYNTAREHQGLDDQTPLAVLKQKRPGIHPAIAHFPPIILDRHFYTLLPTLLPAQNVFDHYPLR